ncbi:MAG: radical SAM protein [Candidatus Omnitrophota bacterium]
MNKKILLLNPQFDVFGHKLIRASFPLGLCYLGTALRNRGYDVRVIDAFIEDVQKRKLAEKNIMRVGARREHIEDMIRDFMPDVLGISCNFHTQFAAAMEIAETAKTRCGVKQVIMGGSYASAVSDRVMKLPFVDYVIIGEGEKTFERLLHNIFEGTPTETARLDGIAYRSGEGKICINPKSDFLRPEEFIIPDRDFLPVEKYIKMNRPHSILTKGKRVLEMLTSRGCDSSCTFCLTNKTQGHFRGASPENVIKELKLLKEKYDIDEVQFIDDNLTSDKERAEKIFGMMRDIRMNLNWCAPNGISLATLDEGLIKLMKQSGCYMVVLPIESGSQRVVTHLMKKPLVLDKVRPVVGHLRKHGVSVEAFLVIGMPGETFSDIKKTFDLVFDLGIFRAHFNYAMPIPSTGLYAESQRLKKRGPRLPDGISERVDDVAAERYFDYRVPVISTNEWTNLELKKYVSGKIRNFYLRYLIFRPQLFIKEVIRVARKRGVFFEVVRYYLACMLKG